MGRSYSDFLASKLQLAPISGISNPEFDVANLKPFQADITAWALRGGRRAVFADTGLGKTRIEALWADTVNRYTRRPVLLFAPLAVAAQSIAEAKRIGVDMSYARMQDDIKSRIYITNYDRLDNFDLSSLGGIALDESSILKSFDGKTKQALCDRAQCVPHRAALTATPAPNDVEELLNHAEFLGILPRVEALSQFFYHDGGDTAKWTLKRHARKAFWRWICSWAAMVKLPSDLGYSDEGYVLPKLHEHWHEVPSTQEDAKAQGLLFAMPVKGLLSQRKAKRATLDKRVEMAAEIVRAGKGPCVTWCELNDESHALTKAIPGAVEVYGSLSTNEKERLLTAFSCGEYDNLVTKTKICGYGMNWQHCNRTVFVGLTHSQEQNYQAIKRFHRFGQNREVHVHYVYSELEREVRANLERKADQAAEMSEEMREFTRQTVAENLRDASVRVRAAYEPSVDIRIPEWLKEERC